MVKEALTFSVRSVDWCIPHCLCECVSVYIDTEAQTACLQPPRLDQLAWLATAGWTGCACVTVCEIKAIFNQAVPLLHPYHTTEALTDLKQHRCITAGLYMVAVCAINNWFKWKVSLKWRNLGPHSSKNKNHTHSDISFPLLLRSLLQLHQIIQMQTMSIKRQRGVKLEK